MLVHTCTDINKIASNFEVHRSPAHHSKDPVALGCILNLVYLDIHPQKNWDKKLQRFPVRDQYKKE